MFPRITHFNRPNGLFRNAILAGELGARFAFGKAFADKSHLIVVKFGLSVTHAFMIANCITSFSDFILNVIHRGSHSQVIGIDTRRVIAGVHDNATGQDVAMNQAIGNTVGIIPSLMSDGEFTVSGFQPSASPQPTGIDAAGFINFRPKSSRIGIKHWNLHSSGPVGAPTPRPATFISLNSTTNPFGGAI